MDSKRVSGASSETVSSLRSRFETRAASVSVVGMGYVGLPFALSFARKGFPTTGFDIDPIEVATLELGEGYVGHIAADEILEEVKGGRFKATRYFERLKGDDLRESPSLRIMELLLQRGARIDYHDPYFPPLPKTRRQSTTPC